MAQTIPTPEAVNAAFLTERLRKTGHDGVTVLDFSSERVGTGQLGRCIRYELELSPADAPAPRSLIGKFPSDDPTSRQTAIQLRSYLKEVSFYRDLQARIAIRTPRCYFAAIAGEGPEFMLLLEDLAPARQGDQLGGCTPEVARAAIAELVGLHASSWCDEGLRGIDWLGEPSEPTILLGRALYRAQLPAFLTRYGARLAPDEARIIESVADSKGAPFELLDDVFGLVHVDYRLDNLLIDEAADPPAVAVVDWQSITLGRPLSDVAYFLGAGLLPEVRRGIERGIVEDYYRRLCAAGVAGYEWERCWSDYRRGTFAGFAVTVIASVMVEQTERGEEMFTAMARRHARHALDHGAEEFLTG
jgi:hypothetical protein